MKVGVKLRAEFGRPMIFRTIEKDFTQLDNKEIVKVKKVGLDKEDKRNFDRETDRRFIIVVKDNGDEIPLD